MLRRIAYSIIGALAIYQAQKHVPHGVSLDGWLTHYILHPFDFLSLSLLFLMGFLMLSVSISYLLKFVFQLRRNRVQVHGADLLEFLILATLFVTLFQFGFWVTLFAAAFAIAFSWLSSDFRIEREIRNMDS